MNAEFQRIARRDKKAGKFQRIARRDKKADKKTFLSDQCKEIEETNRTGKTRALFRKIRDSKGVFHAKMGSIKDRNGNITICLLLFSIVDKRQGRYKGTVFLVTSRARIHSVVSHCSL